MIKFSTTLCSVRFSSLHAQLRIVLFPGILCLLSTSVRDRRVENSLLARLDLERSAMGTSVLLPRTMRAQED